MDDGQLMGVRFQTSILGFLELLMDIRAYRCSSLKYLAVAENQSDQLVSQITRFLMLPEKPLFSLLSDLSTAISSAPGRFCARGTICYLEIQ